ncbi:MAG TPA: FAD-dependent oxidoreductase [Chthoniobacterales bacterium]
MDVDYLIVGQGLAGSLLACLLLQRQRRVLVIDDGHRTAASLAAAGIINPITGKRLTRPQLVDDLLNHAYSTYPDLERFLGARFFARRVVQRMLVSEAEARLWRERRGDPEYRRHLGQPDDPLPPGMRSDHGAFSIATAAQLDVPAFLAATQRLLRAGGCLREGHFEHTAVWADENGAGYQDVRCRFVIFCEGYRMTDNPAFNAIELNPAKGEILGVEAPSFVSDRIFQGGKWLFRNLNGRVLAGTTYSWDALNEQPTDGARDQIQHGLRQFYTEPCRVIWQRAGVRPIIRVDNRPVTGVHPAHPRLAILNGLGSKGALQAPFAAKQLIAKLEENQYIHPHIDVCRVSLWNKRRFA